MIGPLLVALLGADGGSDLSMSATELFSLPAWGTSEKLAKDVWPRLSPVNGVEGASPNWRTQQVSMNVAGVDLRVVSAFFDDSRGLSMATFEFAQTLDHEEETRRRLLFEAFDRAWGAPSASGACHQIWQRPEAQVILERGQISLVAPTRALPGVDYRCLRLRPLPPPKKRLGPP